jgi:hypothetical protein
MWSSDGHFFSSLAACYGAHSIFTYSITRDNDTFGSVLLHRQDNTQLRRNLRDQRGPQPYRHPLLVALILLLPRLASLGIPDQHLSPAFSRREMARHHDLLLGRPSHVPGCLPVFPITYRRQSHEWRGRKLSLSCVRTISKSYP